MKTFFIWQKAKLHSEVHVKGTFSDPSLDKGAATPDIPTQNFQKKFTVPMNFLSLVQVVGTGQFRMASHLSGQIA